MSETPSPCISVCRMNDDTGLCEGCFRTLGEIELWPAMREGEKREVIKAIAKRKTI